ncbi:hypothetical protein BJ742DRAFT_776238 [Cladochytrium replicatum]|nr:hypothetical protein BJ742DRAFT_776238 [Cladochytrium replicatum]
MRLLNIVSGVIETFGSHEEAPPFAALSYVWPATLDRSTRWTVGKITLRNSQTTSLSVAWQVPSCTPVQLDSALRAVYNATEQTRDEHLNLALNLESQAFDHIWMDVLSIDQSSDEDKATEVRFMREYYSKAACVFVFFNTLGESDLPLTQQGPARWFQRLWTLQECVLPEHLLFYAIIPTLNGPRWIDRAHVAAFASYMAMYELYCPTDEECETAGLQLFALGVRNPNTQIALQLSSVRQCRFEHDRVMGILGMISDASIDKSLIRCDYNKPKEEVFLSFLQAMHRDTLIDAFASLAPPINPPPTTAPLSFFGYLSNGTAIIGGAPLTAKHEAVKDLMSEHLYVRSEGLQRDPTMPMYPQNDKFDPALGVTMLASISPVVHMSDHGFGITLDMIIGTYRAIHGLNSNVSKQHYVFGLFIDSALKILSTDVEVPLWADRQVAHYSSSIKLGWAQKFIKFAAKSVKKSNAAGLADGDLMLPIFYGVKARVKNVHLPSGVILTGYGHWPDWIDSAPREKLEGRIVMVYLGDGVATDPLDDNKVTCDTMCFAVCEKFPTNQENEDGTLLLRKVGVFQCIGFDNRTEKWQSLIQTRQSLLTIA